MLMGGAVRAVCTSWSLPAKLQAMLCCAVLSAAGVHPVALLVPGSSAATRLLQGSLFEEAVRFAARSSAQLEWAGVRQTMQENNFSPCIAHA